MDKSPNFVLIDKKFNQLRNSSSPSYSKNLAYVSSNLCLKRPLTPIYNANENSYHF